MVTAVKFTFINQGQQYDELLRPIIIDFLSLIKDGDLVCNTFILFNHVFILFTLSFLVLKFGSFLSPQKITKECS